VLVVSVLGPGQSLAVSGEVGVQDCDAATFVDATGLGALLSAHRRAQRAGRRLVLTRVGPPLARLLFVSRLSRVIAVEDAPAAA